MNVFSIEKFAIPSQQFQQKTFSSSSQDLCFARDEKKAAAISKTLFLHLSLQLDQLEEKT